MGDFISCVAGLNTLESLQQMYHLSWHLATCKPSYECRRFTCWNVEFNHIYISSHMNFFTMRIHLSMHSAVFLTTWLKPNYLKH